MIRICFIFFIHLFSSNLKAQDQASTTPIWKTKKWPTYVSAIRHYQKKFPALYRPLELLPIHKLPQSSFNNHVHQTITRWEDAVNLRAHEEILKYKKQVSKAANKELKELLHQYNLLNPNVFHIRKEIVESIPQESRIAMSPYDLSFLNAGELGKKIKKDLNSLQWVEADEAKINLLKRNVVFFGSLKTPFQKTPQLKPVYELYDVGPAGQQRLFRGRGLINGQLIMPDILINPLYMQGTFFDPKDKSFVPLGNYIPANSLIIDEGGVGHFKGDGHKH